MLESTENLLAVAVEIRELLKLIAEPAIAERDEQLRVALRQIAGKSEAKRRVVQVMDGSLSQLEIRQMIKIDQGDLSKLVKALRGVGLLTQSEKPKLKIPLPAKFFESDERK
jgi:hypothetical protein